MEYIVKNINKSSSGYSVVAHLVVKNKDVATEDNKKVLHLTGLTASEIEKIDIGTKIKVSF